jgi:hypothetical protein
MLRFPPTSGTAIFPTRILSAALAWLKICVIKKGLNEFALLIGDISHGMNDRVGYAYTPTVEFFHIHGIRIYIHLMQNRRALSAWQIS